MSNELIEKEDFKRKRIIAIIMLLVTVVFTFLLITSCSQKTYIITYQVDNEIINVIEVEKFDKLVQPEDPSKEGYEFSYWSVDGREWDFDNIIARDITLIALFDEIE